MTIASDLPPLACQACLMVWLGRNCLSFLSPSSSGRRAMCEICHGNGMERDITLVVGDIEMGRGDGGWLREQRTDEGR